MLCTKALAHRPRRQIRLMLVLKQRNICLAECTSTHSIPRHVSIFAIPVYDKREADKMWGRAM